MRTSLYHRRSRRILWIFNRNSIYCGNGSMSGGSPMTDIASWEWICRMNWLILIVHITCVHAITRGLSRPHTKCSPEMVEMKLCFDFFIWLKSLNLLKILIFRFSTSRKRKLSDFHCHENTTIEVEYIFSMIRIVPTILGFRFEQLWFLVKWVPHDFMRYAWLTELYVIYLLQHSIEIKLHNI